MSDKSEVRKNEVEGTEVQKEEYKALKDLDLSDFIYDGGELGIDFEPFDVWMARFVKRFSDGVEASEVVLSNDLVSSHFKKVTKTILDHVTYTTTFKEGVAATTDNVVKTSFNHPELCADIALLTFEERED
ncbi:MAG: hypothetical protein OXL96_24670 [Candidatus Poribacteria bacterium]|nr:hypothetical protein [Candidatus Poribacteria bacterium]